jgi:hypothetical protein
MTLKKFKDMTGEEIRNLTKEERQEVFLQLIEDTKDLDCGTLLAGSEVSYHKMIRRREVK